MARFFTKDATHLYNLGVGAVNPSLNGAAAISIVARAKATATLGASATNNRLVNVVIDTTIAGALMNVIPAGIAIGGRSVGGATPDTFQQTTGATPVSVGRWFTAGGVLDFGGDALRVFRDGLLDGSAAAVFANTTYTAGTPTANDQLSGATAPEQWPGIIDYIAIYDVDIGDAAMLDIARGAGPLEVQPENLAFYMVPGRGRGLGPDRDVIGNLVPTITGPLPIVPGSPLRKSFPDRLDWRQREFEQTYPAA